MHRSKIRSRIANPRFAVFSRRVDYFGLVIVPPLQNPAKLGGVWHEASGEEGENLVAGGDGWLAGFVDQVGCDHAVGVPNSYREKRCDIGVGRAVMGARGHEAIAERRHVGGEALRAAKPVSLEAISQNRQVFPVQPVADRLDLLGRNLDAGGIIQRQGGLREHRRQHRGLQHHRQREISGEAHADGADPLAAALLVREACQRPQPLRHRA